MSHTPLHILIFALACTMASAAYCCDKEDLPVLQTCCNEPFSPASIIVAFSGQAQLTPSQQLEYLIAKAKQKNIAEGERVRQGIAVQFSQYHFCIAQHFESNLYRIDSFQWEGPKPTDFVSQEGRKKATFEAVEKIQKKIESKSCKSKDQQSINF